MAFNALDDPVCTKENIRKDYFEQGNPNAILCTTRQGSHLAFYATWRAKPWVDTAATEFLHAAVTSHA